MTELSSERIEYLLGRYCVVARPIMLKFMTVNSCIGATRVTCDFFKAMGVPAEPINTKFVVECRSLKLAYTAGFSKEELSTARDTRQAFPKQGWEGHLVARVAKNWLVDATLDAAAVALGGVIPVEHVVNIFPLPESTGDDFHVEYGAIMSNGLTANIHYISANDQSWRKTDAWTDEGLPWLTNQIIKECSK